MHNLCLTLHWPLTVASVGFGEETWISGMTIFVVLMFRVKEGICPFGPRTAVKRSSFKFRFKLLFNILLLNCIKSLVTHTT